LAGRRVRAHFASGRHGDLLLGRCVTNSYCYGDGNSNRYCYGNSNAYRESDSNGNADVDNFPVSDAYTNTAASTDTTASPMMNC
jgi:hypothetical protein